MFISKWKTDILKENVKEFRMEMYLPVLVHERFQSLRINENAALRDTCHIGNSPHDSRRHGNRLWRWTTTAATWRRCHWFWAQWLWLRLRLSLVTVFRIKKPISIEIDCKLLKLCVNYPLLDGDKRQVCWFESCLFDTELFVELIESPRETRDCDWGPYPPKLWLFSTLGLPSGLPSRTSLAWWIMKWIGHAETTVR